MGGCYWISLRRWHGSTLLSNDWLLMWGPSLVMLAIRLKNLSAARLLIHVAIKKSSGEASALHICMLLLLRDTSIARAITKWSKIQACKISLVLHAFESLSRVSPLILVHILQNSYSPSREFSVKRDFLIVLPTPLSFHIVCEHWILLWILWFL